MKRFLLYLAETDTQAFVSSPTPFFPFATMIDR
jgi:hypothetical protein